MTSRVARALLRIACASLVISTLSAAGAAPAAAWPTRAVRVVTPGAPGSGMDATARLLAEQLEKRWKQPIVVENRPGADGFLAIGSFLEAKDGHALLFTTHSAITVTPLLHDKVPYDPGSDLVPISHVVDDFLAIVTEPASPARSLADLVGLARARPQALNFAAAPGSPYLAFVAFQRGVGIELTHVGYRSMVAAIPDLTSGRIQVAVMPLALVVDHARSGKVRLMAVTNETRAAAAPDVPTVAEAGFPVLTFAGVLGLFGPREMAASLREQIATDVRASLQEGNVRRRLESLGLLARGGSPAEFAATIDEQRAKWAAIARAYGARPPQP
ncbi:Bug family tripartite tricarboxylate transporter substrate binding protein [Stella sp.]|uniref:Bug family tripartite tricarboxylate transporter substrate binding protein n=1 Tax=Stella sp. TaxID=2912054 RepID=UPI0035B19570